LKQQHGAKGFNFLGGKQVAGGSSTLVIARRILLTRVAFSEHQAMLRYASYTLQQKNHLYNTLVLLVLLHGCETWITTAERQDHISYAKLLKKFKLEADMLAQNHTHVVKVQQAAHDGTVRDTDRE
jgi:hypothetical protein